LAELLDLSLLAVCLGLITILLHEYLWPFNKFGFVCLFVRRKFHFFYIKHILGFHKQLGKLKFPTFSFDKNNKGQPCITTSNFEAVCFPKMQGILTPPK